MFPLGSGPICRVKLFGVFFGGRKVERRGCARRATGAGQADFALQPVHGASAAVFEQAAEPEAAGHGVQPADWADPQAGARQNRHLEPQ